MRSRKDGGEIYGLVLMGGKSRRMKKDKAQLNYHGLPQYEYCYDLLSRFCSRVYLSTRKGQKGNAQFKKIPQVVDLKAFAGSGPLAGILSAMSRSPKVGWLVLGCDLPFIDERTIENLIKKRDVRKIATAYRSVYDGMPEPVCAIYEPKARGRMLKFFRQGVLCPRKILINSNVRLLDLLDKRSLDNINDPTEYTAAVKLLAKEGRAAFKKIHLQYFAVFREQRGLNRETILTKALTVHDLYSEITKRFDFKLPRSSVRPAMDNEFVSWKAVLKPDAQVAFIPPVAGG